jgi:hypothetical protein
MGIDAYMNYYVIEGEHTDTNDITTIVQSKQQMHGTMVRAQADATTQQLVRKNIDNYYYRAWVINKEIKNNLNLK